MGRCTRSFSSMGNYWPEYNSQFSNTQNQSYPHHGSVDHNNLPVPSKQSTQHSYPATAYAKATLQKQPKHHERDPKDRKEPDPYQKVNQCQLFLQVTWLLEMTDAPGNVVLPEFLEYKGTHTNTSKSNLNWPVQTLPPPKSWESGKN
jgi:hypothetical protein